jgi:hypothetical protein
MAAPFPRFLRTGAPPRVPFLTRVPPSVPARASWHRDCPASHDRLGRPPVAAVKDA